MILGVVADDLTGAGDLGSMTAKAGYLSHVYSSDTFAGSAADVCILDTDSRLDTPEGAYGKVYRATQALMAAGCTRFFNKTCSVFRGNIGAEFDAMLDALGETFAVVVLGFPKNGRITRDGIHYVHGQRLEDSPFRHDPVHPMLRSDLVAILGAQTERQVALVTHETVAQGEAALRAEIARMRSQTNYLILDVADQEALVTIAAAVQDVRVLCGSSALAETLPAHWPPPTLEAQSVSLPPATTGVLCIAGSLTPQTLAQVAHFAEYSGRAFKLDTLKLLEPDLRQAELERLITCSLESLEGGHTLVYAANDEATVRATQAQGEALGLSRSAVSRLVSGSLAEVAAACRDTLALTRLVVAGGDTSATVCRRLGIRGTRILHEIKPGLPSSLSLSEPPLLLVLKSGSFGAPDFLEEAIEHLQEVTS